MHVNSIQTEVIHPNEWKYYNKTCPRQWAAGINLAGKGGRRRNSGKIKKQRRELSGGRRDEH